MKSWAAAGLLVCAASAHAEVLSSTPNGFHLRHSVALSVPAADAFSAFAKVERWWDPEHSYGG